MVTENPLEGKRLVVVVGYPRSGNNWISRMIGSCLGAPVMGPPPFYHEAAVSEGLDRKSDYAVVMGHFYSVPQDVFLNRSGINLARKGDAKVVLIVRDPRDVAVSVQHYWKMSTLEQAVRGMLHSYGPLDPMPISARAWHLFYDEWLTTVPDFTIRYREMRLNTAWELRHLFIELGLPFDAARADETVHSYQIEERKRHMQIHGDSYYFGKEAQLEIIRSGMVSYWNKHWTQREAELVKDIWWNNLYRLGYESDPDWWKKLGAT